MTEWNGDEVLDNKCRAVIQHRSFSLKAISHPTEDPNFSLKMAFMHLFERWSGKKNTEIFHLLVNFLNISKSWGSFRSMLEAGNSICVPHMGAGTQITKPTLLLPMAEWAASWQQELELGM